MSEEKLVLSDPAFDEVTRGVVTIDTLEELKKKIVLCGSN